MAPLRLIFSFFVAGLLGVEAGHGGHKKKKTEEGTFDSIARVSHSLHGGLFRDIEGHLHHHNEPCHEQCRKAKPKDAWKEYGRDGSDLCPSFCG